MRILVQSTITIAGYSLADFNYLLKLPFFYYYIAVALLIATLIAKKKLNISVLIAYLFLVFSFTVLNRKPLTDMPNYGMVPFWSYRAILFGGYTPTSHEKLILQIVSNILMFFPVGALAAISYGWQAIDIALISSIVIEVSQFISKKGLFEFDDIFHNTLGTAIGVAVVMLVKRLVKKNESN